MEALTGQIIEIDQDALNIGSHAANGLVYLNQKYVGGGVLTELLSNESTLKASLTSTDGTQFSASLPVQGFLSVGDVMTVVKDDDGCELYYINHSRKRDWSAGRSPKNARDMYRIAKMSINGGLFWAVLVGIPASLASWSSLGMNIIVFGCLTAAVLAGIWSLTFRAWQISGHNRAAVAMAEQEAITQEGYILEKEQRRVDRLKSEIE